jgi:hypothetical protein
MKIPLHNSAPLFLQENIFYTTAAVLSACANGTAKRKTTGLKVTKNNITAEP